MQVMGRTHLHVPCVCVSVCSGCGLGGGVVDDGGGGVCVCVCSGCVLGGGDGDGDGGSGVCVR